MTQRMRDAIQSVFRELQLMSKEEFAEALEYSKKDPRHSTLLRLLDYDSWLRHQDRYQWFNPPLYCMVAVYHAELRLAWKEEFIKYLYSLDNSIVKIPTP